MLGESEIYFLVYSAPASKLVLKKFLVPNTAESHDSVYSIQGGLDSL
jgi:hypothetical protein